MNEIRKKLGISIAITQYDRINELEIEIKIGEIKGEDNAHENSNHARELSDERSGNGQRIEQNSCRSTQRILRVPSLVPTLLVPVT